MSWVIANEHFTKQMSSANWWNQFSQSTTLEKGIGMFLEHDLFLK